MKRSTAIFLALLTLLTGGTVFAQAKAPLTVIASQGPAQVLLNGRVVGVANPSLTVQFAPGRYELTVKKPGLPEYRQTVVLPPGGITVQARLGGQAHVESRPVPPPVVAKPLFNLTINSNVNGAQVSINGSVVGRAPMQATLEAGSYQVTVNSPGYDAYSATVVVNGNANHFANLRQTANRLTVNANVNGAEVYINGVKAGNAPFAADLAPGSFNVRVTAPGYQEYNTTVVMNGPQNVSASLIPMMATLTISLPASSRDSGRDNNRNNSRDNNRDNNRGRDRNAESYDVYIDGNKLNGLSAPLAPGRRVIRVEYDDLVAETVLMVEAGRSYTVEPTFSLSVR